MICSNKDELEVLLLPKTRKLFTICLNNLYIFMRILTALIQMIAKILFTFLSKKRTISARLSFHSKPKYLVH